MRIIPALICALAAATIPWQTRPASGQDDVFDFIPDGGRTLLEGLARTGLNDDLADAIATETGDAAAWRDKLVAAQADSAIDSWQLDTLAQYLAANAPMDPAGDLPRDGRDMVLAQCQSCHIVTVVVTQDRTRDAWLGTLHKPSHIEINLTEDERGALADYLVLNAGIPIDLVPPELRAGGASY
ncbi:hypothetical protein ILP92_13205 [Maribius pontilimi]|uniref:Cytochrome c domain-containing protein n=1 Tax=Palleronia pontilimi TaxID=1964209 RepID=A0A934IKL1_9RHOB|nr:hypothetical protein [Palleronia pontilimi]MBJ3763709.1 hypothetical protein [Palleronia pontilimi]